MADESTGLLSTWRILRKRRTAAISVAGVVFAGVAIYTLTRVPVYQSETLLLMNNPTSIPVVEEQAKLDQQYSFTGQAKSLATEIQILQSKSLVSKAVEMIRDKYPELKTDDVVKNLGIFQIEDAGVLSVSYRDVLPERVVAMLNSLGKTYVNYSLETRRSQATNAIKFIQEKLPEVQRDMDKSAEDLRKFRMTNNIPDPALLVSSMGDISITLHKQLEQAQLDLSASQKRYQMLRQTVGKSPQDAMNISILSQNVQYQKYLAQLQDAESNYALERARFKDANPAVQLLKSRRDQALALVQDQAHQLLGDRVQNLPSPASTLQESLDSGTVSERKEAPTQVSRTPATFESLQLSMVGDLLAAATDVSVRQTTVRGLAAASNSAEAQMQRIPALQKRYEALTREYTLTQTNYTTLRQKLEELRITEAQESSPWKIIEPPYTPEEPISPKTLPNLLLGLVGGVLLGLGSAFLIEILDERVKGVEEAKELAGLPLLGAIPRSNVFMDQEDEDDTLPATDEQSLSRRFQRSPFKESLRSLATNIRYLSSDRSVRVLGITSSIPAEGKSTVSYNLALVMAELGRKVLIIDADMRKPSLHKLMEVANTQGLSTVLATGTPWQEVILETEQPNLQAMTSGPLPPNPVMLLDSPRVASLVKELKEHYDFVIFDTPPVVGLTDAQVLSVNMDGMVLLVALERSNRSALQRATEVLKGGSTPVLGLIVNLLDEGNEGYYYQYYYSYYGEPMPNGNGNGNGSANSNKNGARKRTNVDKGNALTNLFKPKNK